MNLIHYYNRADQILTYDRQMVILSLIPPSKKRCKELGGYSFTIGYSSDGTCQFAESSSIGIDGTCQDFEVCTSKEYPEYIGHFLMEFFY